MADTLQVDYPQVAVESMNATHANEHRLLQELLAALNGDNEEALAAAVEAFSTHVHEHFAREEGLMQEYGFPPYPMHKGEHERLLAHLDEICANWQTPEGRAALKRFAEVEYPTWLSQHVSTMDMVTAQFLAMHGVE